MIYIVAGVAIVALLFGYLLYLMFTSGDPAADPPEFYRDAATRWPETFSAASAAKTAEMRSAASQLGSASNSAKPETLGNGIEAVPLSRRQEAIADWMKRREAARDAFKAPKSVYRVVYNRHSGVWVVEQASVEVPARPARMSGYGDGAGYMNAPYNSGMPLSILVGTSGMHSAEDYETDDPKPYIQWRVISPADFPFRTKDAAVAWLRAYAAPPADPVEFDENGVLINKTAATKAGKSK